MSASPFDSSHAAAEHLRARGVAPPKVALVLGSGLGAWADSIEDAVAIPYSEIPGFRQSTVSGHAGRLVAGRKFGVAVVAMQGRVHPYEGATAQEVVFPIRSLWQLGARTLVVTNAAGGVNADFSPGDLMLIRDHLNLTGDSPLRGPNDDRFGPRFPDMSYAYDPSLRALAHSVASQHGIALREGVYAGLLGPTYETPAEVRMVRTLGGDAVGMSTVFEVIAARHMGMRVVGLSCVTNAAAGVSAQPLDHAEVTAVAAMARDQLTTLVDGILANMDAQ